MARPSTGSIQRKHTRRGVVYGLQYTFHGQRLYERFGGEWEGWDDERAENRRRAIALLIERGEWIPTPPSLASLPPRRRATAMSPCATTWPATSPVARNASATVVSPRAAWTT